MRKFYLLLLLLCLFQIAFAQKSLIQDTKGESSLIINGASNRLLSINVSDASLNFSLLDKSNIENRLFWGGNIKFKTSENVATLLSGYNFNPSANLDFYTGKYFSKQKTPTRRIIRIWYIAPGVANDQFKLLASNELVNKSFLGYSLKVGINKIGVTWNKPTLIGYAVRVGRFNNTSDLGTVDVYSKTDTGSQVILQDKKTGYVNNYHAYHAIRFDVDYALFPFDKYKFISLAVYGRGQLYGYQPQQKVGIGLFVAQKGAPTKIVTGITFQVNDLLNRVTDESLFVKRTSVNLVAGFNF